MHARELGGAGLSTIVPRHAMGEWLQGSDLMGRGC